MNRKQEPLWMKKLSVVHADIDDPTLHIARKVDFPLSCKEQLQMLSQAACAALLTPSDSEEEQAALYALSYVVANFVDNENVALPETLSEVSFTLKHPSWPQRVRGAWQLLCSGSLRLPLVRRLKP